MSAFHFLALPVALGSFSFSCFPIALGSFSFSCFLIALGSQTFQKKSQIIKTAIKQVKMFIYLGVAALCIVIFSIEHYQRLRGGPTISTFLYACSNRLEIIFWTIGSTIAKL